MKNLHKYMILFVLSLSLTACQWSLEPLPNSEIAIDELAPKTKNFKRYELQVDGSHKEIFTEVWEAEAERSPIRPKFLSAEVVDATIKITVESYEFEENDSLDLVPGVIFPGLIPFGPLSIWWTYEDLSVDTPSLEVKVLAELVPTGQNKPLSNAEPASLKVNVVSTLGITTEENLARNAFALASVKVMEWLENHNAK